MEGNPVKGYLLANTLCNALGEYAYIVTGEVGKQACEIQAYGNWAGNVPSGLQSRAPHVAYGKFGELVLAGAGVNGELVMTPVPGNEMSYKWMGGVAQNGFGVAVSKWAQEHDQLLALLTLYHCVHQDLHLHHVGFRFATHAEYEEANSHFMNGMVRPAEDHERMYVNMGPFYREHQFFPGVPRQSSRHWDFVCEQPKELLLFLAHAYNTEPVTWIAGENDPIGVVWVQAGSDGSKLGVMARSKWWNIED